jgi:hypothetical protein
VSDGKALILSGLALAVVLSAVFLISAHFEAAAFNRVTGKHVSTLDAVFLDLRVMAAPSDTVRSK